MKIARSRLEEIIREETLAHVGRLLREKGAEPDVEDAAGEDQPPEKKDKQKPASDRQPDNVAGKPAGKKDAVPPEGEVPGDDEEKPAPDDEPADTDLEKQAVGDDAGTGDEDEAGPDKTEKLSDQLVGKTIQSVTANPKSKMMPGAMEIVVQFDQVPDPLKILITKSGAVKYFYRGLHNEI